MPNSDEPRNEPTPEEYRQAAEDQLELAKVLAGQGAMSDQDFLERMVRSEVLAGDGETCGMSHNILIGAQVAREMLAAGEYEDVVHKWAVESRRRWEASKFVKLWQAEQQARRAPEQAFRERGWEP